MYYKIDKLYTYTLKNDSGFSPNPFWGCCTLACCKPKIRETVGKKWDKSKNIWVIGISPKNRGNEVSYIMKVNDYLTFSEYYEKYPKKIPDFTKKVKHKCGDNIYKPKENGSGFEQLRSLHSNNKFDDDYWSFNRTNYIHDLNGKYVLISKEFIYFGNKTVPLYGDLKTLIVGRAHKCKFDREILDSAQRFINKYSEDIKKKKIVGPPNRWPKYDKSWNLSSCG